MATVGEIEDLIDLVIDPKVNQDLVKALKTKIKESKKSTNYKSNSLIFEKLFRKNIKEVNNDNNPNRKEYNKSSLASDIYVVALERNKNCEPYTNPKHILTKYDGAYLSKLMAATEDSKMICSMGCDIIMSDKDLLEKALIKTGDIFNLLEFGKYAKGFNTTKLLSNYITEVCNSKHIENYLDNAYKQHIIAAQPIFEAYKEVTVELWEYLDKIERLRQKHLDRASEQNNKEGI